MPHIVIEYSENIAGETDIPGLVQELHATLAKEESVDLKRIKSRAVPLKIYTVGDKGATASMVHVVLKLMPRPDHVAKRMALDLQNIVKAKVVPATSVTVEVVTLNPETYCA